MQYNIPIKRDEVIGKRINCIWQFDLPYDVEKEYLERLIAIELESGLRISLDADTEVPDTKTGFGLIYPYVASTVFYPEIDARRNVNLNSPVKAMFLPYGWKFSIGFLLENGFVIHNAINMTENLASLYKPGAGTMASMRIFELPN